MLEAAGWTLLSLVIGRAIDGVLAESSRGLPEFAGLGVVAMGIGIARRLVDSRAYARIYAKLGEELAGRRAESGTSTTMARLGTLRLPVSRRLRLEAAPFYGADTQLHGNAPRPTRCAGQPDLVDYSARNTVIGSSRAARRAGSTEAASAARATAAATAANVSGSYGVTP